MQGAASNPAKSDQPQIKVFIYAIAKSLQVPEEGSSTEMSLLAHCNLDISYPGFFSMYKFSKKKSKSQKVIIFRGSCSK